MTAAAELSSLSTMLENVIDRVTGIAEHRTRGGQPDDVAAALFEVERSLQEARRRLRRALDIATPTSS